MSGHSDEVIALENELRDVRKDARGLMAERDELIAFVKHVAEHFENTRLPLGIQARALLAKYPVPG